MPYEVKVGVPDEDKPTFVLPFWTRRFAEREAAVARTKRGVGFIFTPLLSLPGKTYPEGQHLWATVERIGWWACLRRKLP